MRTNADLTKENHDKGCALGPCVLCGAPFTKVQAFMDGDSECKGEPKEIGIAPAPYGTLPYAQVYECQACFRIFWHHSKYPD